MMQHTRRRTIFRRRKATTDYRRRLRLLKSEKARAVVRVQHPHHRADLVPWGRRWHVVVSTP